MNTDGSGRTKLTTREDRHGLAAFSPDGPKISFTASEDIWTMNADGSNQVPVTTHPAPDIQSSWQPLAGTSGPPAGTSPPPAGTSPPSAAPDTTKPGLKLSVSPATFRAAGSGATISRKRKVGTKVSYRLSEAASVRFRVERASLGWRSQGKCVKPRRANRRGKRCTRYVTLRGSFTHKGKAGLNKFKFRGRLGMSLVGRGVGQLPLPGAVGVHGEDVVVAAFELPLEGDLRAVGREGRLGLVCAGASFGRAPTAFARWRPTRRRTARRSRASASGSSYAEPSLGRG